MPNKSYPDTDAYGALSNKREVKVLSWNIWWKFEDYLSRQKLIFDELKNSQPDILCLQEVWEDNDGSFHHCLPILLEGIKCRVENF